MQTIEETIQALNFKAFKSSAQRKCLIRSFNKFAKKRILSIYFSITKVRKQMFCFSRKNGRHDKTTVFSNLKCCCGTVSVMLSIWMVETRNGKKGRDDGLQRSLSSFSSDSSGELNVLWHDCDSLGVDGAQVCVFEKSDEVRFGGFL